MGSIVIADTALGDGSTLVASGAVAGLPVTNLLTDQPGELWATTGTRATVRAVLPGQAVVGLVALVGSNITATGTWRVRLGDDAYDCVASPAWDSGWMTDPTGDPAEPTVSADFVNGVYVAGQAARRVRLWCVPPGIAARHARIDIADPVSPAGRIEAGRLVISEAWKPAQPYAYGNSNLGAMDDSPRSVARGGQVYLDATGIRETMVVDMPHQGEADALGPGLALLRSVGRSRPLFVGLDPDDTVWRQARSIYGTLTSLDPAAFVAHQLYSFRFSIEELPA